MRIHILNDEPLYEHMTLIAAYADRRMAERRLKKMRRQREQWLEKQRRLDEEGSDEAYASAAPHMYEDLCVCSLPVIPPAYWPARAARNERL